MAVVTIDNLDTSNLKRACLVVPTIRESCMKMFIDSWSKYGLFDIVDLIVMEDNPKKTFDILNIFPFNGTLLHLSWEDIEKELKEDAWIIPRRSDTVRSFAYYYSYKLGYEFIMTLDDDCYPPEQEFGEDYCRNFVGSHITYLVNRAQWFNTLNSVKPRGMPYYNLGRMSNVVLNHGLWTNVLDYDAPTQLSNPKEEKFSFDNRLVPKGLYFPMCGMNLMWRSDITVLMYHLLMGKQMDATNNLHQLPFDRFGDIWCGLFMKKICDHLNLSVSSGMPYVRHERASNPFTNLKKEANGLEVNEKLWQYVDSLELGGNNIYDQYNQLANHIMEFNEFKDYSTYFTTLGVAMNTWVNLFRSVDDERKTKNNNL